MPRVLTTRTVIWRIQLFGGFARFYASVYRASAALQIVFFVRSPSRH